MNRCVRLGILGPLLLVLPVRGLRAEEAAPQGDPRVDDLLHRIEELERTVASQEETIRKLQALLPAAPPEATPTAPAAVTPPPSELEQQLAKELGQTAQQPSSAPPTPAAPGPITIASGGGGKSYVNLSLDALVAGGTSSEPDVGPLEPGGHDPIQRGFTVQNVEMVLDG